MIRIVTAVMFVILSGCTTTGNICVSQLVLGALAPCEKLTTKFERQPTRAGKSLIYLYRPDAFAGAWREVPVFVNGQKLGSVANETYQFFYVDPGVVEIEAKPPGYSDPLLLSETLLPGVSYYFELRQTVSTIGTVMHFEAILRAVPEESALPVIRSCYSMPERSAQQAIQPDVFASVSLRQKRGLT